MEHQEIWEELYRLKGKQELLQSKVNKLEARIEPLEKKAGIIRITLPHTGRNIHGTE